MSLTVEQFTSGFERTARELPKVEWDKIDEDLFGQYEQQLDWMVEHYGEFYAKADEAMRARLRAANEAITQWQLGGTEPIPRSLVLSFIKSLTLCDHMRDVANQIDRFLPRIDARLAWETFDDLQDALDDVPYMHELPDP